MQTRRTFGQNRTLALLLGCGGLFLVCAVCGGIALFALPGERGTESQATSTPVVAIARSTDTPEPAATPKPTDTATSVAAQSTQAPPTPAPVTQPPPTTTVPQAPAIPFRITEPATGATVETETVTVRGTGAPGSQVEHRVFLGDSNPATVDQAGRWQTQVMLRRGDNELTFVQKGQEEARQSVTIKYSPPEPPPAPTDTPEQTPPPLILEPTPTPPVRGGGKPKPGQLVWAVTGVVDGETIKLSLDGRTVTVRPIGIDTPETGDRDETVQCFGPQASKRARSLLMGKRVRIATDPTQDERDQHDRLFAYMWRTDNLFYNLQMVKGGFAKEYTFENSAYSYQREFHSAQEEARTSQRGLWAPQTCNGDTTQPAEPEPTETPEPEATDTPEPEPTNAPQPTRTPTPTPADDRDDDVYYANCAAVKAAGRAPLLRGQPGYSRKLDRDGDGVACEK